MGDSRIRAKNLEWKKKQKPPIGNNWVVMGSEQYSRLVVPYYLQKEASHLHVTFVRQKQLSLPLFYYKANILHHKESIKLSVLLEKNMILLVRESKSFS